MKNKNIILIILGAVIIVVVGVFCSIFLLYKAYNNKVNDALSKVKVPVAKKDIAKGEMISFNDLTYKMANKDIKTGDIIKKSDVSDFVN